jgi:hypothetical protein
MGIFYEIKAADGVSRSAVVIGEIRPSSSSLGDEGKCLVMEGTLETRWKWEDTKNASRK